MPRLGAARPRVSAPPLLPAVPSCASLPPPPPPVRPPLRPPAPRAAASAPAPAPSPAASVLSPFSTRARSVRRRRSSLHHASSSACLAALASRVDSLYSCSIAITTSCARTTALATAASSFFCSLSPSSPAALHAGSSPDSTNLTASQLAAPTASPWARPSAASAAARTTRLHSHQAASGVSRSRAVAGTSFSTPRSAFASAVPYVPQSTRAHLHSPRTTCLDCWVHKIR